MKYNKGISIIKLFFFVLFLIILIFIVTYFSGKDSFRIIVNNFSSIPLIKNLINIEPKINSLEARNNNFIIKGKYLSKVEIWYQIHSKDPTKTSETMVSESSSFSELFLVQKFKVPITCGPFAPIQVYAKGYNEKGDILNNTVNLDLSKNENFYLNVCPKDNSLDIKNGYFIVDSLTGLNIKDYILSINGEEFDNTIAFSEYVKSLQDGVYDLSIEREGYKSLKNMKLIVPGGLSNSVVPLEPINVKNNIPAIEKGKLRIYGYITNEIHNPIPNVLVSLKNYNLTTNSDDEGFYYIDIIPGTADLCTNNIISYEKEGYIINTITNFGSGYIKTGLEGTSINSSVTLKKGKGEFATDQKFHMCP